MTEEPSSADVGVLNPGPGKFGSAVFDGSGRCTAACLTFLEIVRVPEEEILGQGLSEILDQAGLDAGAGFSAFLAGASDALDFEAFRRGNDGNQIIRVEICRLAIAKPEPAVVVQLADVTAVRALRRQLELTEIRIGWLVSTIDDVVYMIDPDTGEMTYVSPGYEKVWGRPVEELYANARVALESVVPEDRAKVMAVMPIQDRRGDFECEYRIRRPDGGIRHIRDRGFVIRDEAGDIEQFIGIASDVTEQRTMQQSIAEAQRLEAVGQLTGELAHDFNNLLAIIRLNATNALDSEDALEPQVATALETISDTAGRGADITKSLLAVARRQALDPKVYDLAELLLADRKLLEMALGSDSRLVLSAGGDPIPARIDASTFSNVLLNIAINARDAMPAGGTLEIRLRRRLIRGREPFAVAASLKPGPYVVVEAEDTGTGMSEEVVARAFEPFFTTKEEGFGSGLGLAILYGFARQLGGTAQIDSALGRGTTVRLILPMEDGVALAAEPMRPAAAKVLIVDDEPALLSGLKAFLERRGFAVVASGSASDALARLSEQKFDLMLTDVAMREISGLELAGAAQARYPDLPIIRTSGFEAKFKREGLRWPILGKTKLHQELVPAIEKALGRSDRLEGA